MPNSFSYGNPLVINKKLTNNYKNSVASPITKWSSAIVDRSKCAYVVGTFDTKEQELFFVHDPLTKQVLTTIAVDVSTAGKQSPADITANIIAQHHPQGKSAVFNNDRGRAVNARLR